MSVCCFADQLFSDMSKEHNSGQGQSGSTEPTDTSLHQLITSLLAYDLVCLSVYLSVFLNVFKRSV
jgi:hypothetical protein